MMPIRCANAICRNVVSNVTPQLAAAIREIDKTIYDSEFEIPAGRFPEKVGYSPIENLFPKKLEDRLKDAMSRLEEDLCPRY